MTDCEHAINAKRQGNHAGSGQGPGTPQARNGTSKNKLTKASNHARETRQNTVSKRCRRWGYVSAKWRLVRPDRTTSVAPLRRRVTPIGGMNVLGRDGKKLAALLAMTA
ncbi:hypothetical protein HPT27_11540 [Permianibacter sp. IMCC34836]|uniref:hypothetical protein n=1 Tax=Permianibacter fluminis TaxID=2738515 RepID=UPI0015520BF3|nr:hypothetical protein [Permianibacter fluminis]NQD37659.1 hypothetical protein [Permianibacter fluminis]